MFCRYFLPAPKNRRTKSPSGERAEVGGRVFFADSSIKISRLIILEPRGAGTHHISRIPMHMHTQTLSTYIPTYLYDIPEILRTRYTLSFAWCARVCRSA